MTCKIIGQYLGKQNPGLHMQPWNAVKLKLHLFICCMSVARDLLQMVIPICGYLAYTVIAELIWNTDFFRGVWKVG